jgi:Sigma-70, region 4
MKCNEKCIELETSCPCDKCRYHIDYEDDFNCCLISIDKSETGFLTMEEVAKRLGISYQRISQIETKAAQAVSKRVMNSKYSDKKSFEVFENYLELLNNNDLEYKVNTTITTNNDELL